MIERGFDRAVRAIIALKYRYVRSRIKWHNRGLATGSSGRVQDLRPYSDPQCVNSFNTWGRGTAWTEIQYLLTLVEGRVLDVACGTGEVLEEIEALRSCQPYGCDLSGYLLKHAVARGISPGRFAVCDATRLPYVDGAFSCTYSIGSLEHFSETGIGDMLAESRRTARDFSFHQIPTSRSNRDEGWITAGQSYFNNSVDWWRPRFGRVFPTVDVLESRWEDAISVGRWFVCKGRE